MAGDAVSKKATTKRSGKSRKSTIPAAPHTFALSDAVQPVRCSTPTCVYETPKFASDRFILGRISPRNPSPIIWDRARSCGFAIPGARPEHVVEVVSWLNGLVAQINSLIIQRADLDSEIAKAAQVDPRGKLALGRRVKELEAQLAQLQAQFDLKVKECEAYKSAAAARVEEMAGALFDADGKPLGESDGETVSVPRADLDAIKAELDRGKETAAKLEQLQKVHAAFVEAQGNLSRQAKGGGNSCSGRAGFDAVAAVGARLKKQLGDIFTTEPGGVPQSYRRGTIEELAELLGLGQAAGNPDKDAQAKTDTAHMELLQRIGARVSGLYEDAPVEENPAQRGVAANDAARAACDFAIAALREADKVAAAVIATMSLPQLNAASASVGGSVSGAFCAAYTGALRAIQKHREQFIEPPKPKPPGS